MSGHLPWASASGTTASLRVVSVYHQHCTCFRWESLVSVCGLHPSTMIIAGCREGTPFVIFFIPSFKPDLLPSEWLLWAPTYGWKGGVNGFLFLLPFRPFPSLLPALLHRSLGWERQRGRVFLIPRAWKGLWGYFTLFLFQAGIYAEAKHKAGKNEMKNPQALVRCWSQPSPANGRDI